MRWRVGLRRARDREQALELERKPGSCYGAWLGNGSEAGSALLLGRRVRLEPGSDLELQLALERVREWDPE
jgi:hypothetical protein